MRRGKKSAFYWIQGFAPYLRSFRACSKRSGASVDTFENILDYRRMSNSSSILVWETWCGMMPLIVYGANRMPWKCDAM